MIPYYEDDYITIYNADSLAHPDLWVHGDVLITDPPYGIPGGRVGSHPGGRPQVHADADWDSIANRDQALDAWGDRPRAVFGSPAQDSPGHRGFPLIWDKGNSPGMGDPKWPFGPSYELIWVRGTGWSGTRRASVFRTPQLSRAAREIGHPTPKPVALMEALIEYAPPGTIADPFAGSGATLIAARNLGRRAIGVEIEERYCEITAKRLSQQAFDLGGI